MLSKIMTRIQCLTTMSTLVKTFGLILVAFFLTAASAGEQGVSVGTIHIVSENPDFAEVEIAGVNELVSEQLCMVVAAKSADGTTFSLDFSPVMLSGEWKYKASTRVWGPRGMASQQTDLLTVKVFACNKDFSLQNIKARQKFTWRHVWPEKKIEAYGNDENHVRLSNLSPWQIISENLIDEDFVALDTIVKKWNDPRERDPNGEWKLGGFSEVFVSNASSKRDWKGDLARLQRWRSFNPKSAGAAIAEARYWVAYAWHIRGNITSREVDPFALKLFGERMLRAEQILKDAKSFSADNPLWYETYLEICVASKRDDGFVDVLYREAIARHPYFQPLYLNMAKYWASKFNKTQDWAKADAVIRQAVRNSALIDGEGNYAMLYVQIGEHQECGCNLFSDSQISWGKMREAFKDLVDRYPSMVNLNQFAAFACRADDRETFFSIRPRIANHIIPNMWLDGYSPDLCDRKYMLKT